MNTILFTGGGTAGHVSPNLALSNYFIEKNYEVHYIGSYTGIEKDMVKPPIIYHGISTGKLRRYFDLKNFTDPFRIIKGYIQSKKLLKKIKPNIIFSKGGFVSVPVVMAANSLNIPVILHESDMTPGLANKLCIPKCDLICTSFEKTLDSTKGKGVLTGTPIRPMLKLGNVEYAKTKLKDFDHNNPTIMIMGGSLGAGAINEQIRSIMRGLTSSFNILHICGKNNLDPHLNSVKGYMQFEFVNEELADFITYSDIIVSRSGATSIFEFLSLNKPMLLIPLPLSQSRGDQILNAKYFEEKGYAKVLRQEDMNDETLLKGILELYQDRENIKTAQKQSKTFNSNEIIIELIENHKR